MTLSRAHTQLKCSARNKQGYSLSDGEGVERLWAYLRRFSRMTKEMRPSHCVDVLVSDLFQYSRCASNRLGKDHSIILPLLINEMCSNSTTLKDEKALKIQEESKLQLEKLMSSSPGLITFLTSPHQYLVTSPII